MPAIERVIPLVGHLPASIRDALARRLRELSGLGLIVLSWTIFIQGLGLTIPVWPDF